jgi:hypothetical protein
MALDEAITAYSSAVAGPVVRQNEIVSFAGIHRPPSSATGLD